MLYWKIRASSRTKSQTAFFNLGEGNRVDFENAVILATTNMMKYALLLTSLLYTNVLLAQTDAVDQNQSVSLHNAAEINSQGYDFSPTFYRDGLVFVSSRRQTGPVDESLGETFFELYFAPLDPNGVPKQPRPFSLAINSRSHEGPVTFNREQNKIYYSSTQGRVKIYQAERGELDWENVQPLPFNNEDYTFRHPAISPDGRMLYFASNMPGSKGGLDIWVVLKEGNGWSQPINMGGKVNTPKDEAFPFMHDSGTLFFSSKGHKGYGGLDLFMMDVSGGYFGEVINLGPPFNSKQDDLGIILRPDGKRGYFASNRPGGKGKDDIYYFEAPKGIQGVTFPEISNVSIAVYSEYTGRSVAWAAVHIYEREVGKDGKEKLYKLGDIPSSSGEGQLNFQRQGIEEGEANEPLFLTNEQGKGYTTLDVSREYVILVEKSGFATKEVVYKPEENVYNRPVDIGLEPDNCITLSGLTENTYGEVLPRTTIRIINGCTDKMSTLSSNANGTFQTCIEKGCEFEIISELPGYQKLSKTISTVDLRSKRSFSVKMRMQPAPAAGSSDEKPAQPAAPDTSSKISKARTLVRSGELRRSDIKQGAAFILDDIHYDFEKADIREGEAGSLDELAQLMKEDDSMEIELIAHTDCRGEEAYNLKLSLERAESAKAYLIDKGIEPNRIRAFGYGEAVPLNDCDCSSGKRCTDEQYEENRRTELRILKVRKQ